MSKQIGVLILTDNVGELRGIINRLEEVYNDITVLNVPGSAGNVPGATATPDVVDVPGVPGMGTTQADPSVVDINGMPWDARIHSSAVNPDGSHKTTGKGVWQKRRGTDEETLKRVEAELMATAAGEGALPSGPDDQDTVQPGVPSGPSVPGVPSKPVLPVPADISTSTLQDCINIAQVFAEIHGVDAMQHHLSEWKMNAIEDLQQSPNLYPAYVQYMVEQDASAS